MFHPNFGALFPHKSIKAPIINTLSCLLLFSSTVKHQNSSFSEENESTVDFAAI